MCYINEAYESRAHTNLTCASSDNTKSYFIPVTSDEPH